MVDNLSRFHGLTRSQLMSRIRSRGNKKTELAMIAFFRMRRITGWRRHQPLPGRPDFIFRKERVAVFVDGCFWHGCPVHYRKPKTSARFWSEKIEANRRRDVRVTRALRKLGWRVLRFWECGLTSRENGLRVARRILGALTKARSE
jgi:DNA mismatch endonuclease, patch repair protein